MWIISSYGIYVLKVEDMINNQVSDYKLYTLSNGLTSTPTANLYGTLDEEGFLYIPGRSGVCRVNIDHFMEERLKVRTALHSVSCGDELILPDQEGTYLLPASEGRIKIQASVMDYTLFDPTVRIFIDGEEENGITAKKSALSTLEYTGLRYGNYVLHIQVIDHDGKEIVDDTYQFVKMPRFSELPIYQLLLLFFVAAAAGIIVWRIMKGTIIQRQYREIGQAKEEAERANTAKSRFLANMSHEIRTPIHTIMGINEMVFREDAAGVPKGYFMTIMNYAFDIRNASETLLRLVDELLDMSKVESGGMNLVEQEYDTREMLRSIISMIRVRCTRKELSFDVDVDEILPRRMYGDAGKIKQIVINLLTNAVKYTETGGLSFRVSMEERENESCKVKFSVKDTGIGIPQKDIEKLFSYYEGLEEEKNSLIQGTGLGLDISKKFTDLMGGSLSCESSYGKGSEFVLTISQKIVDKTPWGIFQEHEDGKEKGPYLPQFIAPDADILVVDDHPMNLNVIKGLLKETRIFITTAKSGKECLERIRETKFHLVLLDDLMPGMDGIETISRIREIDPELPVYALTTNVTLGEEFYFSQGFNGYLLKPFDSETLERVVMKHIPEEIMEQPLMENAAEEPAELPKSMQWLYKTKGISVSEGIQNSGGISGYIFGLNLFLDTIEENAAMIRTAYESGNLKQYTMKVHSLKISARIIGAMELYELAAMLEEAGNKGNRKKIDVNTKRLLSEYEAFLEKLSKLRKEAGEDEICLNSSESIN